MDSCKNLSFDIGQMVIPFEILLIIAETNFRIWRIMTSSIPSIGRYSLNPNVQERLKDKWKEKRVVNKPVHRIIKTVLPSGEKHGEYIKMWVKLNSDLVAEGYSIQFFELDTNQYFEPYLKDFFIWVECRYCPNNNNYAILYNVINSYKEGKYRNGKKEGKWVKYKYESIHYKGTYKNGKKHGMWTYWLDEILLEKILEHQKSRLKREILIEFYYKGYIESVKKIYYKNGVASEKYRIFIGEKKYVFNT